MKVQIVIIKERRKTKKIIVFRKNKCQNAAFCESPCRFIFPCNVIKTTTRKENINKRYNSLKLAFHQFFISLKMTKYENVCTKQAPKQAQSITWIEIKYGKIIY